MAGYVSLFLAHGIRVPYLPVAMKRMGHGGQVIGETLALTLLVQLLGPPVWGYLSDRCGSGRLVVAASLGSALGVTLSALSPDSWLFFLGIMIFAGSSSGVGPLLDSQALAHPSVGPARFGQIRRYGSLSFLIAVLTGGLVLDLLSARGILTLMAVLWMLVSAVAILTLAGSGIREHVTMGIPPVELLRRRRIWVFLGMTMLHAACCVPFESYFANHGADVGLPSRWIGIAWALGVGLEVLVLTHLGSMVDRLGPRRILFVAYWTALVRWILTAAVPGGPVLALIQVLHGIGFGAANGASVVWMNRLVPGTLRASGQSLFSAITWGLGGILGQLCCGPIYDLLGGRPLFALAAVVQVVPLAVLASLQEPGPEPEPM